MSLNTHGSIDIQTEILNEYKRISSQISDLREVTYKYKDLGDGTFLNETIFSDLIGKGYGNLSPVVLKQNTYSYIGKQGWLEELKVEATEKLLELRSKLIDLKSRVNSVDIENNNDLLKSIKILIVAVDFTQNALIAELSKAGYIHNLSDTQISEITERQNELDEQLFGEKVINNQDYLQDSYTFIIYLLTKDGNSLDPGKKQRMQGYLGKLVEQAELLGLDIDKEKVYEDDKESEDPFMEELRKIKIEREDFIIIYNCLFELSGVPQRAEIGNYGSLFDGDGVFGVPNNEAYKSMGGKETMTVPAHEATHYINLLVTTLQRYGVKLPGDMIKEEGLASLVEKLISGIPLDKINYFRDPMASVIFANLLPGELYRDFSDIYSDLLVADGIREKKGDLDANVRRKKRGFFHDIPGGPNKDASYAIGLYEVKKYLMEKKALPPLLGGKISMEDVESGKYLPDDFGNKFIIPLITSELVMFYLKQEKEIVGDKKREIRTEKGSFHKDFINHLKNKYSFFNHYFDHFSETDLFTMDQRRKVLKIIRKFQKELKDD